MSTWCGFVDICDGNSYFTELFGNKVDWKNTIAHSLAGKSMLSIEHIKSFSVHIGINIAPILV